MGSLHEAIRTLQSPAASVDLQALEGALTGASIGSPLRSCLAHQLTMFCALRASFAAQEAGEIDAPRQRDITETVSERQLTLIPLGTARTATDGSAVENQQQKDLPHEATKNVLRLVQGDVAQAKKRW